MTGAGSQQVVTYSALMGIFLTLLVFQTALWPAPGNIPPPQLIFPVLVYFCLSSGLGFALCLLLGAGVLGTGFSTLSFFNLFSAYLLIYIPTVILHGFYHWKRFFFFLTACILWTALFPLLPELFSRLSPRPYFTAPSVFFIAGSALFTAGWGACIYPALKHFGPAPRF